MDDDQKEEISRTIMLRAAKYLQWYNGELCWYFVEKDARITGDFCRFLCRVQ